jgi:hypothetical protein
MGVACDPRANAAAVIWTFSKVSLYLFGVNLFGVNLFGVNLFP